MSTCEKTNPKTDHAPAPSLRELQQQHALACENLDRESAKCGKLAQRVGQLNRQVEYLKAESAVREQGVRYRLGDALVRAARPSRDTLMLPARIARLLIEGLKRRRTRSRTAEVSDGPAGRPPANTRAFLFCCIDETGAERHRRGCAIARRLHGLQPELPVHVLSAPQAFARLRPEGLVLHELPRAPRAWQGRALQRWCARVEKSIRKISGPHADVTLVYDGPPLLLPEINRGRAGSVSRVAAVVSWHTPVEQLPGSPTVHGVVDQLIVAGEAGVDTPLEEWLPPELDSRVANLVAPVTYSEPEDLPPRKVARSHLGLATNATVMCLCPPAVDSEAWTRRVLDAVPAREDLKLVISHAPGAVSTDLPIVDGRILRLPSEYPLWHVADVAIATPEYSTVYELLRSRVPTVLVPDPEVAEQVKRAAHLHRALAAIAVNRPDDLHQAIQLVLLPVVRESLSTMAEKLVTRNGAEDAARSLLTVTSTVDALHAGG